MRHNLAIEGHDGVGKSTIAALLAQAVNGAVVKPFNSSLGDFIAWLWRNEDFDLADSVARAAVRKGIEADQLDDRRYLIFDRHWLTMFTVLPERLHCLWEPRPPTVLLTSNLSTVCRRLEARGEPIGDVGKHEYYLNRYTYSAKRYDVPIVDTSDALPEEATRIVARAALL